MSYSTGAGGYGDPSQSSSGGYGQPAQGYGASSGLTQGKGLPFFLNLGVIALGVISFFLGFTSFETLGGYGSPSVSFFQHGGGVVSLAAVLAAALVAAFAMLPKQDSHDSVVAALSVAGFISLLFLLVGLPEDANAGLGLVLVLITSFLQSALAIAVLLFSSDIIKSPQPRQASYGYYGQGAYGQGAYGQSQLPGQPQQPYYGSSAPGAPPTTPSYQPPPSQPQQPPNPW